MFNKIYPQVWMSLSTEVKNVLIAAFNMKRTGPVEIFNNEVRSDGFGVSDLDAINIESMSSWIGAIEKLSFIPAWELTLKKVEFILNPPPVDYVIPEPIDTPKKNDEQPTGVTTAEVPSTIVEVAGNLLETQKTELSIITTTPSIGQNEINSSNEEITDKKTNAKKNK